MPFERDDAARADLEQGAHLTDESLAALGAAEAALERQEYASVESNYRQALEKAEEALATVKRVRDCYDPLGREQSDFDFYEIALPPVVAIMLIIGGCAALFGLIIGAQNVLNRLRRSSRRW